MRSVRTLSMIGLLAASWLMPAVARAQVTADDFLPPVLGGPTDVKQPGHVAMKGQTVTAATAQDAINVAVQENVKQLADNIEEVGARMVQFPSGLGFVATGAADRMSALWREVVGERSRAVAAPGVGIARDQAGGHRVPTALA